MKSAYGWIALAAICFFVAAQGCAVFNDTESVQPQGGIEPFDLRCEYMTTPLCVDAPHPRLSWKLRSTDPSARGQKQTAYRIIAASKLGLLSPDNADLWDSGRVESSNQIQVSFSNTGLSSGQRCHWKVRVWDRDNNPSKWSKASWWEMGILTQQDWEGCWIDDGETNPVNDEDYYKDDPAPIFRKEFFLHKPVRSARLYISGLGLYEAYINNERTGDSLLDPGWTTYSERVLYSTFDVSGQIRLGNNAIAVILGNGWYNPLPLKMWGWLNLREHLDIGRPRIIAKLMIEHTNGTFTTVATSTDWKTGKSAILRNNLYLGEKYDARLEQPGWKDVGFDDSSWPMASEVKEKLGPLCSQAQPPVRRISTLKAVSVTEPKPGIFIYDFGQNLAGWAKLKVKGSAGTAVNLRFGELLYPDGTLNGMTAVCGQIKSIGKGGDGAPDIAYQKDTYILGGDEEELFTPRFTFHGFRYVEVTGFPGTPNKNNLEAVQLCADVKSAGEFTCSDKQINRIQKMVRRTFISNLFSVQSDCPAREKFGYGGDIVAVSDAFIYNFDMAAFYSKVVRDFGDSAKKMGALTETAPYVGIADSGFGGASGPPGWTMAHTLLIERLYRYYGDTKIIEEQYETGLKHLALLQSKAKDYIIDKGISDHESLVEKPTPITGTSFYFQNAKIMSRLSHLIGRENDSVRFASLASNIRNSFIKHFLKPGTGIINTGVQTSLAAGLFFDLIPSEEKEAALNALIERVINLHDSHLSTGIFGARYLLNALTDAGRADIAASIVKQTTYPGWGYMLEKNATTLWEHWEFSDSTYSHNHPMFGSVSEWFFETLGGLAPHEEANGFDRIVIKPRIVGGLSWAKTMYKSIRGEIALDWRIKDGVFSLSTKIPVNTSAILHLPAEDASNVMVGDQLASMAEGVSLLREEKGAVIYNIDSGEYRFLTVLADR